MTDAFDEGWNVLKDFYHDPNEPGTAGIARLWRHGMESEKRDRGASFARTRMEEHLQGRGSRKVAGSALPDQVGMNPMHVRQAGDTSYTAGVNLQSDEAQSHATGLANEDPQVANEAFNQFVSGSVSRSGWGDDSGAAGTLLHEHGHGLMHDELSETHESGFWGNTADAKKQKSRAHEIGAYSLQYPGGPLEEVAAQRRVEQHPDANKVPYQMPRVPRPAYNQYDKYGDEESGWEQEVTDKLQSNHPLVYANTRQGTDRRWAEENPGVQGRLRSGL